MNALLTSTLKATIRKHALSNGERCAKWDDATMWRYAVENGLVAGEMAADSAPVETPAATSYKLPGDFVACVWRHLKKNDVRSKGKSHVQLAKHVLAHSDYFGDHMVEQANRYLISRDEIATGKTLLPIPGEPAQAPESDSESIPATPAPTPTDEDAALLELLKRVRGEGRKPAELDEGRVVELIREHSTNPQPVTLTIEKPELEKPLDLGLVHFQQERVIRWIQAGVNLACPGPAGSGKSTIFENAAKALGMEYGFISAPQTPGDIKGWLTPAGEVVRTQFRERYEHGGLMVVEEFDGGTARAVLSINNAAAGGWCDFPDGMVKRHPDFVLVMAGNTYGSGANRQYVGRNKLDDASLDRFTFLEIDYDPALERAIVEAQSGAEVAAAWVPLVQRFRALVQAKEWPHVVSPRASIMGAKLLAAGESMSHVKAATLYKGLDRSKLSALEGWEA